MKNQCCASGLVSIAMLVLLAGCVTNPERQEHLSVIKIVSATPVHVTVSAPPGHQQGTEFIAPALAAPKVDGRTYMPQERAVASKANAFASLSDGPLVPAEISLLFSGLEVTTHDRIPERHLFRGNGQVDGVVETGRDRGNGSGTVEEDSGSWSVTEMARLCLDWLDWYSGDRACYSVSKRGDKVLLTGGPYPVHYEIQN